MNKLLTVILAATIGGLIVFFVFGNKSSEADTKETSDVIIEKIEKVNKLISLESSVSEVYTFEESDKFFYGYLKIPKKAIVIAKAKVYISHDLSKMKYKLDKENKTVILGEIPEPEIIIEPSLKFYDLKAEFIPFTEEELNKLNERATNLLRKQVMQSDLIKLAEKNLQLNLQEIILTVESKGWEIKKAPM